MFSFCLRAINFQLTRRQLQTLLPGAGGVGGGGGGAGAGLGHSLGLGAWPRLLFACRLISV